MERFGRICAVLTLTFVLGGCGASTTAPVTGGEDTTAARSIVPSGTFFGPLRGLMTRTASLDGDLGTAVDNGRWHAFVPPHAVDGDAQVTIGVSSRTAGECVIEVVPATMNKFEKPATVRVDCRSLTDRQLSEAVLYEFDPVREKWLEVPGSTVDPVSRSVSASVDHYARFAVGPVGGKAGW